jgi:hypothetical protein
MKEKNKPTSRRVDDSALKSTSSERAEIPPLRKLETRLGLPVGEPDLDALRSLTRDWLVPLLVEKFLHEQGIELRAPSNANPKKTPISNT